MVKNTNCDPCEEQGNITEGTSWCSNYEEKLCNGCASHHRSSKGYKIPQTIRHQTVNSIIACAGSKTTMLK